MSPGINSLIKVPGLIGSLLGSLYSGLLTDRYAQWCARKHNGNFEPETCLVALVLPFFFVPIGLLMFLLINVSDSRYGWGCENKTHWVVPFVGNAFVLFGAASIPGITFTYSAPPISLH
jgi:MFS family permease